MNTIELFCGTKSFSKVMDSRDFQTLTIDYDISFNPDICVNILDIDRLKYKYDIFWASPPCQAFSVASIGKNWEKGNIPKSESSKLGLLLLEQTIRLIANEKPRFWFIENPRGMMRKVIDDIFKKYGVTNYKRVEVCYCQYGDTRMKPTDIWTNLVSWEGKMCKNGNNDHISAPRGSRTGTQGLKNAKERGVIPEKLFKEILIEIKKELIK